MSVFDTFFPKKDYLVCVDSDGCAMDTMDIKHIRCFGPCMVDEWGLDEWREPILKRWNDINLYTMTRGINRFKGLAMALGEIHEKLSIVFEDVAAARETLDRVRTFIRQNPTVYLSTHTPLGYENLEAKAVVDLDDPPESKPVGEILAAEATGKYICSVCGYVYDPAEHDGVAFEDLPDDWRCPRCKQPKEKFNKA